MTRFRAPSASTVSAVVQDAHPQGSKPRKPHVTPRRVRIHKLDKAKEAAKDVADRALRTKNLFEPSVVYVGNIGPGVDEDALKNHFKSCGYILSAEIHCAGGVAASIKPPPDGYSESDDIRLFGIVVFESKLGRYKARKLKNALHGRTPVVCLAISDIPVIHEKIVKRLDKYRSRLEPADPHRAQMSALKSLRLEPTDILDPVYEKKQKLHNPFQIMGLPFLNGIM